MGREGVRMSKYTEYIWTLPVEDQADLLVELVFAGVEGEDLDKAMDGRVCDLEDTIDVSAYR